MCHQGPFQPVPPTTELCQCVRGDFQGPLDPDAAFTQPPEAFSPTANEGGQAPCGGSGVEGRYKMAEGRAGWKAGESGA